MDRMEHSGASQGINGMDRNQTRHGATNYGGQRPGGPPRQVRRPEVRSPVMYPSLPRPLPRSACASRWTGITPTTPPGLLKLVEEETSTLLLLTHPATAATVNRKRERDAWHQPQRWATDSNRRNSSSAAWNRNSPVTNYATAFTSCTAAASEKSYVEATASGWHLPVSPANIDNLAIAPGHQRGGDTLGNVKERPVKFGSDTVPSWRASSSIRGRSSDARTCAYLADSHGAQHPGFGQQIGDPGRKTRLPPDDGEIAA